MEIVPFAGRDRNVRLVSGDLELIATLDVGPRILRFGRIGGPNHLKVYQRHEGLAGGDEYRSYGGHRLWVAPEVRERTLVPDNLPVAATEDGDGLWLVPPPEAWGIQKAIRIEPTLGGFRLTHRIERLHGDAIEIAPWSITVVEPGGVCFAPLPEPLSHEQRVLPVAPIALWGYTDMSDARFSWGPSLVRLRHGNAGPTKIGMQVHQGWAAHSNFGELFVKRFAWQGDATYPDFGCNFEAYTRADMLEVESLGPLTTLAAGQACEHVERWELIENWTDGSDQEILARLADS